MIITIEQLAGMDKDTILQTLSPLSPSELWEVFLMLEDLDKHIREQNIAEIRRLATKEIIVPV